MKVYNELRRIGITPKNFGMALTMIQLVSHKEMADGFFNEEHKEMFKDKWKKVYAQYGESVRKELGFNNPFTIDVNTMEFVLFDTDAPNVLINTHKIFDAPEGRKMVMVAEDTEDFIRLSLI